MILDKISNISIDYKSSIMQSLKIMDTQKVKLLFVFSDEKFRGLLTIGDIQRAIIAGVDLSNGLSEILDTKKIYASIDDDLSSIKEQMFNLRAECMPVLDTKGNLVDVYFWKDLFGREEKKQKNQLNIPVVIMAGGKGTRLAPLTNVFPKPMIPVGEKTIIETIMDKFVAYGCHDFHLSVNYKADTIKNYFDFVANPDYNISYFQEDKPMGTAGSLRLLKNKINSTFFVSNCDILIEEDYATILDYHKKNENELTVVAAVKTFSIPY